MKFKLKVEFTKLLDFNCVGRIAKEVLDSPEFYFQTAVNMVSAHELTPLVQSLPFLQSLRSIVPHMILLAYHRTNH